MKIQFLTGCLLTGLVCLPLDFVSQTQVLAADQAVSTVQNNSANQYKQYMLLGYKLTGRRDYKKAQGYFQKALEIRPGDRYATTAIRNVTSYINRRSVIAFVAGKPRRTNSGATRGGTKPVALTPTDLEVQFTTAKHPTFFFYIPEKLKEATLKFVLLDADKNTVYEKELIPTKKEGIVSVALPVDKPSLNTGKEYTWTLTRIYRSPGVPNDERVQGKIQLIQDDILSKQIQQTTQPLEQAVLYTTAGVWENALTILVDLRRQRPNDPQVQEYWQQLLGSVKLEKLADVPLL